MADVRAAIRARDTAAAEASRVIGARKTSLLANRDEHNKLSGPSKHYINIRYVHTNKRECGPYQAWQGATTECDPLWRLPPSRTATVVSARNVRQIMRGCDVKITSRCNVSTAFGA